MHLQRFSRISREFCGDPPAKMGESSWVLHMSDFSPEFLYRHRCEVNAAFFLVNIDFTQPSDTASRSIICRRLYDVVRSPAADGVCRLEMRCSCHRCRSSPGAVPRSMLYARIPSTTATQPHQLLEAMWHLVYGIQRLCHRSLCRRQSVSPTRLTICSMPRPVSSLMGTCPSDVRPLETSCGTELPC